MFKLHVIQAEYGDCLIVEFGTPEQPRYILVDGGPPTTYERHLRAKLQEIAAGGGKLDLVVLSHVDTDHVIGLLDLTSELREQRANDAPETIAVEALWHNTFEQTIGHGTDIESRLSMAMAAAGVGSAALASTGAVLQGIGEGRQLGRDAILLGLSVNDGFADDLISVDGVPDMPPLGNLTLRVVGPTQENLEELRRKWQQWLDTHADNITSEDPLLAAMADRSIPNLASIMLLAEADGKKMLLTGDGRGDHLLQGLAQAGLLSADGTLHVDLFKIPHHGSDRNVTRRFFKAVTADTYVISANGLHDNPDLATLIWIVEAAKQQKRKIEIVLTNETPSSEQLASNYDGKEYDYTLRVMPKGAHALPIDLAPGS